MFDCWYALTGRPRGCSCRRRKRGDGTGTADRSTAETRFLSATAYVRHVTAAAIEGRSWRCQGLHSDTFLPYGSLQVDRLAAACHRSLRWALNCCRPAGRTNAPTADHAWAWFQGTDRLETARDRREPSYHRLRDHDAGPYPEGRRHRRDPDCADGNTTRPHRARRAMRGRCVLYADVL